MNVADILAGGARLVRTQPRAVAIWGALYLIVSISMLPLVWPMFTDMVAFEQQVSIAQTSHLAPPEVPTSFMTIMFALGSVFLALMIAIFAAAMRGVVHGGHDKFGFLRVGKDELRLLGLTVLLGILQIAVVFLASFAIGIAAAVASLSSSSAGAALAALLAIAAMAFLIWCAVRISLAGALTMLRGRIVIREAWRATRGRFWTLFGVFLIMGIAYFAVTFLLSMIFGVSMLGAYAGDADALTRQQAMFGNPFAPSLIFFWLVSAVIMIVGTAFCFGAIATAAIGYDRIDHSADGAGLGS